MSQPQSSSDVIGNVVQDNPNEGNTGENAIAQPSAGGSGNASAEIEKNGDEAANASFDHPASTSMVKYDENSLKDELEFFFALKKLKESATQTDHVSPYWMSPSKSIPYFPLRARSMPLTEKLLYGYYVHGCPCQQILKEHIFETLGCICRILFYGVSIPNCEKRADGSVSPAVNAYFKDLRFFKGARMDDPSW